MAFRVRFVISLLRWLGFVICDLMIGMGVVFRLYSSFLGLRLVL